MKKYIIVFYIILLLFPIEQLIAQMKVYSTDSHFEEENYKVALRKYLLLHKRREYKYDLEVNYHIAICYLKLDGDKTRAFEYLKFAYKYRKRLPIDVYYYYGLGFFYKYEFDSTVTFLSKYLELAQKRVKKKSLNQKELTNLQQMIKQAQRYIEMSANAKQLIKSPINVSFINLGENINYKSCEYNPFVSKDDKLLIYSSDRQYDSFFERFVHNVYYSVSLEGVWQKGRPAGKEINSTEDESIVWLGHDGKTIIILEKQFGTASNILYSVKGKYKFETPKYFNNYINSKYDEQGACFTFNNDTLYFASNRPGGLGGFDIYYSIKLPNNDWGNAINLGESINTPYDDNYPNISEDSKTLYFASKGHNSMGGYDIFVSHKINNKWSQPQNLGYPLNDIYDNKTISFTASKKYAYISSYKKEGYGDLDIYKVVFEEREDPTVIYRGIIATGNKNNPVSLTKVDSNINIMVYKLDITYEEYDGLTDTKLKKMKLENVFGSYKYNKKTGKYLIALPPGFYVIKITGKAYQNFLKKIYVPPGQPEKPIVDMDIFLRKKLTQQQKNIYKYRRY